MSEETTTVPETSGTDQFGLEPEVYKQLTLAHVEALRDFRQRLEVLEQNNQQLTRFITHELNYGFGEIRSKIQNNDKEVA